MKRTISTIAAFCIPIGLYWLAGYEFVRGIQLAMVIYISVGASILTYIHPDWNAK